MTRADDVTTSHEDVGRVPRRRGVVNGFLLVLLGLWGATIPLFGPYLGLSYGTDDPWMFGGDRWLMNFLPGLAVVLGGLGLMGSARSVGGAFWGWLAAVGGAWFVVGPTVSGLWNGQTAADEPLAASTAGRVVTELVYFTGLGALIVFLAAVALGRFTAGTGQTVVVPEQDRGEYDSEYDARHRAAGGATAGDVTRDDVYEQGARDEAQRRDGIDRRDVVDRRDGTDRRGVIGEDGHLIGTPEEEARRHRTGR